MVLWQVVLIVFFAVVLVWSVAWALLSAAGRPSGPSVADIIARIEREDG
ncbi:hypothetical protein [Nocardia asteroides]|nr:hypothetical protein [Nocardia asteroides]UGT59020.1 hypothetical protein LTT61_17105 [Nocardia asteroides]